MMEYGVQRAGVPNNKWWMGNEYLFIMYDTQIE